MVVEVAGAAAQQPELPLELDDLMVLTITESGGVGFQYPGVTVFRRPDVVIAAVGLRPTYYP